LTGTKFGSSPPVGAVKMGLVNISVSAWSAGSITALTVQMDPDAGGGADMMVYAIRGQVSNVVRYTFDAPVISFINPSVGPCVGSINLDVTGSSFARFVGSIVWDGTLIITPTVRQFTRFTFTVPAGIGTNHNITVRIQGRDSNAAFFNYNPPTITAISPPNTLTSGGANLTVTGINFGRTVDGPLTATIAGQPCTVSTNRIDSTFYCLTPPGQGDNNVLQVVVGGQVATYNFIYGAPVITQVRGCTNNGNATEFCPILGGLNITMDGRNFGYSVGGSQPLSVTIDGAPCTGLVMAINHTRIICTLPSGNGENVTIAMFRGSQLFLSNSFLSYSGAKITPNTLRAIPGTLQHLEHHIVY